MRKLFYKQLFFYIYNLTNWEVSMVLYNKQVKFILKVWGDMYKKFKFS